MLADQMVAPVATPPVGPDGLEALLRRLLPTTPVPPPPPKPIPTDTVMSAGTDAHSTTQDRHHGIGDLAAAPDSGLADAQRLGYDCVFLLWQIGSRSGPVPRIE